LQAIIPAYKPDERLLTLVKALREATDFHIIVVNDGSGEQYEHIFNALPEYVTLLSHGKNRGKGRAMKTAFEYILEHESEDAGAVIVDADGQHLLTDIIKVSDELIQNPGCLIIGARQFTGTVPLRSRFGNSLTRIVFSLASGVKLSDTQTGLRAIPIHTLGKFLSLGGERYEFEMNMLLYAAEAGIPMHEVTIETVYIDDNASSHFNVIRDSLKIYAVIFKFIFSSLISTVIDYALFAILSAATLGMPNKNLSRLVCVGGARIVSSFCNYLINRNAVFKGSTGKNTILKYYLVVGIVFASNYGVLTFFENVCHWNKFIAQALSMLIIYPLSYYLQRMFVFRTRSKKI
jgi:glycosyltransferase involved in cell wall biosynthesis